MKRPGKGGGDTLRVAQEFCTPLEPNPEFPRTLCFPSLLYPYPLPLLIYFSPSVLHVLFRLFFSSRQLRGKDVAFRPRRQIAGVRPPVSDGFFLVCKIGKDVFENQRARAWLVACIHQTFGPSLPHPIPPWALPLASPLS